MAAIRRRFLLFAWDEFGDGGFNDFKGEFADALEADAELHEYDSGHVVDMDTGEIVLRLGGE